MALPVNRQQEVMDYDYGLLQALVGEMPGATYNIGLRTLTREPELLEKVPLERMPWLCQFDGDGEGTYAPSSTVAEEFDSCWLGYVRRDAERFPGLSSPQLRRLVMADVCFILDSAEHRGHASDGHALVGGWSRVWEVFDDPAGAWSMFLITERLKYSRYTRP